MGESKWLQMTSLSTIPFICDTQSTVLFYVASSLINLHTLQFSMPIHTAELVLHGRNYVTAGRVDREADSRSSGVTHRNQHHQCLESHFELKLN